MELLSLLVKASDQPLMTDLVVQVKESEMEGESDR